jgi:hypothetical protein
MIYSFTVTFGATYLTGMITNVSPYEIFSLIKKVDGNLGSGCGHAQICSSYKLFNELPSKM